MNYILYHKEKQKIKTYNFSRFAKGSSVSNESSDTSSTDNRFDLKHINFNGKPNNPNDMDPIQMNQSDSPYRFNNEDAITSYNSNNNNKK